MRSYCDCIICYFRQALESTRFVTNDEICHQQVLREVLRTVSAEDMRETPVRVARRIQQIVRNITGVDDPYAEVKDESNHAMLEQFGKYSELVRTSLDPLETAIRLAIAGNVIDYGASEFVDIADVSGSIKHALTSQIDTAALEEFRSALRRAHTILYLGDNAGEIVFDRLLIDLLPREKITYVVRGRPILNDVTMKDAQTAGITYLVDVIDNGSDAPGTLLDTCSDTFRQQFNEADLIIAKGQGNYESLSGIDKDIFYLLIAKCPVIADHIGCLVNSIVLLRSTRQPSLAIVKRVVKESIGWP
jgi:damage-control phosphatase, subfamily I